MFQTITPTTEKRTRVTDFIDLYTEFHKAVSWFNKRIESNQPYKHRLSEYRNLEERTDSLWSMLSQDQKVEAMNILIERGDIPVLARETLKSWNGTLITLKG